MNSPSRNAFMRLFNPIALHHFTRGVVFLSITSIISGPFLFYAIMPAYNSLFGAVEKPVALLEYRTTVDRSYSDVLQDPTIPASIKAVKAIIPPILYRPSIKSIIDMIIYFVITAQGMKFFVGLLNPRLTNRKTCEPDVAALKQLIIKAHKKNLKHRANELKNVKSYLRMYQSWFECHRKHCNKLDEDDPRIYLFSENSEIPEHPLDSVHMEDLHERLMGEEMRRREVKIRCQKEKITYLTTCLESVEEDLGNLRSITRDDEGNEETLPKENIALKQELEEFQDMVKGYVNHVKKWSSHSSEEMKC